MGAVLGMDGSGLRKGHALPASWEGDGIRHACDLDLAHALGFRV